MDSKKLKGTIRSQLGPLFIFVLLVTRLISRTGLSVDHRMTTEGYVELALAVVAFAITCANIIAPPTLTLDESGFSWRSWRYTASYPWSAIERFFAGPSILGGKRKIAFNFLPGEIPTKVTTTKLNRSINGFDRSMTNVWNMPSDELVDLLNDYLRRAGRHA